MGIWAENFNLSRKVFGQKDDYELVSALRNECQWKQVFLTWEWCFFSHSPHGFGKTLTIVKPLHSFFMKISCTLQRSKLDTQYYKNRKEIYRYVLALRASASPLVTTNTKKVWQRFWVPVGSTGASHPLNGSKLGYNKQRLLLSRLDEQGWGLRLSINNLKLPQSKCATLSEQQVPCFGGAAW